METPSREHGAVEGQRVRRLCCLARFIVAAAATILLPGPWSTAQAQVEASREYDLKAVFIHNLATFVEWPAAAFAKSDGEFVIGVLGDDPFGHVLDDVIANEFVGKHPIVVRRLRRNDDFAQCHLLFISASERRRLQDILRKVGGRPVLTVGDIPDFLEAGGMIGFGRQGAQIELLVNSSAVRAAELVVSSKLLEVARVIDTFAVKP